MTNSSFLPYLIPACATVYEEEIKKSRFITYLEHCSTLEEAKRFVIEIKNKHADARHNCWAFIAGKPQDSMKYGFSDDGEPSGTAGKPMLAQLVGSGIGEIVAVVTRYYGGIQLGTGGLVKAYGGGVQSALKQLNTTEKAIKVVRQIHCDYSSHAILESILLNYGVVFQYVDFKEAVEMIIEVDARYIDDLILEVTNRFKGRIIIQTLK